MGVTKRQQQFRNVARSIVGVARNRSRNGVSVSNTELGTGEEKEFTVETAYPRRVHPHHDRYCLSKDTNTVLAEKLRPVAAMLKAETKRPAPRVEIDHDFKVSDDFVRDAKQWNRSAPKRPRYNADVLVQKRQSKLPKATALPKMKKPEPRIAPVTETSSSPRKPRMLPVVPTIENARWTPVPVTRGRRLNATPTTVMAPKKRGRPRKVVESSEPTMNNKPDKDGFYTWD